MRSGPRKCTISSDCHEHGPSEVRGTERGNRVCSMFVEYSSRLLLFTMDNRYACNQEEFSIFMQIVMSTSGG